MTPKSVGVSTATVFVTTDGKKFDDQKSAEAHQLGVNRRKAIFDKVKMLVPAGRPNTAERIEDLTTFLYHHIEELQCLIDKMRAAELLNHHQREQDR